MATSSAVPLLQKSSQLPVLAIQTAPCSRMKASFSTLASTPTFVMVTVRMKTSLPIKAAVLDRVLGWGLVPDTVWVEEGPFGPGSLQEWIDEAEQGNSPDKFKRTDKQLRKGGTQLWR